MFSPALRPLQLTLVPDGEAGGRASGVRGQLDEEVPGRAEQALVGQILHLVRVVQGSRVDAVSIPDQQPAAKGTV